MYGDLGSCYESWRRYNHDMVEALVTLLIVAAAGGYLAWSVFRAARGGSEGCGGCGCGTSRKRGTMETDSRRVELHVSASTPRNEK